MNVIRQGLAMRMPRVRMVLGILPARVKMVLLGMKHIVRVSISQSF